MQYNLLFLETDNTPRSSLTPETLQSPCYAHVGDDLIQSKQKRDVVATNDSTVGPKSKLGI